MSVTVDTSDGMLLGQQAQGVCAFLGIPFAKPPVGRWRFRAPQPVEPWSGVRDATRMAASAPQAVELMPDVPSWSEDCLYLNVWTTAADTGRRPVMVWLHGGAFISGSAGQPMYDGAELCRRGDVVVVTVNYRLGALGFAYLTDLLGSTHPVEANLGLRDQIAALRWVRENIEAFGGDPDNVTLFGESAGAMSLSCLLSAPKARGLFRRAIAQSGAAHFVVPPTEATRIAEVFLQALDIAPSEAARLWEVTPEDILKAQVACMRQTIRRGAAGRALPQTQLALLPVADGDVLPEDPIGALESGVARELPLLLGTTRDEWNLFVMFADPRKQTLDDAALLKVCERRLPGHGEMAIARYRDELNKTAKPQPWEIFCAFETDRMFRIPAIRLAEMQSKHQRQTFMYLLDWPSPLCEGNLRSCHAMDVFFVFGAVEQSIGRSFTGGGPIARALSQKMMDAWLAFARGDDPSHQALGEWPPYDAEKRFTMTLGQQCEIQLAPMDRLRAFWDGIL